jgi:hypothetical protein
MTAMNLLRCFRWFKVPTAVSSTCSIVFPFSLVPKTTSSPTSAGFVLVEYRFKAYSAVVVLSSSPETVLWRTRVRARLVGMRSCSESPPVGPGSLDQPIFGDTSRKTIGSLLTRVVVGTQTGAVSTRAELDPKLGES